MILESLLIVLVAFNTVGCGFVIWFMSKRTDSVLSYMARDKTALLKLLSKCQDRIQAQTLTDYNVIRATGDGQADHQTYYDRSDQGEADIARAVNVRP